MTTSTTANKQLIQVTVGSELDTWGPYVNQNTTSIDNILGVRTVVTVGGANITLSSAQYSAALITFSSTLTANISVTLPAVGSFYIFLNVATGSSQFTITLTTTVSSGQHIALPWWEAVDVITDGTNVKFKNLDRVGTYVDLASSSVPAWITACSVPPYLYCNGSSFSSATYPVLSAMFEGTSSPGHLPDLRGRAKFALDTAGIRGYSSVGSGQLFKSPSGANGTVAVSSTEIPFQIGNQVTAGSVTGGSSYYSVDPQVSGGGTVTNLPPLITAGITLIRAG